MVSIPSPCWPSAARRTRGGARAWTLGAIDQRCRDSLSSVRNAEERLYATADIGRTAARHGTGPALWGQYRSRGDPPPGSAARPWHDGPVRSPRIGRAGAVDARRYGHGGGYVQSGPESEGRWPVYRIAALLAAAPLVQAAPARSPMASRATPPQQQGGGRATAGTHGPAAASWSLASPAGDAEGKRNKKVAIKHGFEGAWEFILAWDVLRVCASASPLGGPCHFSSPRVLHS
jgi:hypothetical protein